MYWSKACFLLAALLFAAGCTSGSGPKYREGDVTIAYLRSMYGRQAVTVEGDVYITGRVVSTDHHGNFYKTLVVEDATGGIVVRIDLENYHRTYFYGTQLRIACNSLVLSSYGGTLQLGAYSYDEGTADLGHIPEDRLSAIITIGEDEDELPAPTPITIPELAPGHISRMVIIRDVQFVDGGAGLKWCEQDADTDRMIVDRNGNRMAVRTSRYANFAGRVLPAGSGAIVGVVSYFNGAYQLTVHSDMLSVFMDSPRF